MTARPFLKWAGGKSKLVGLIISSMTNHMPLGTDWTVSAGQTYHEPFVGSASVFLGLRDAGVIKEGASAFLSDINPVLVQTLKAVQDEEDIELVIQKLAEMESEFEDGGADYYYSKRGAMNRGVSSDSDEHRAEIAARMIFINKTCFNGLWRVNSKGEFNVPIGRPSNGAKRAILQEDRLRSFNISSRGVALGVCDWRESMSRVGEGDLVYVDPPYLPIVDGEYVFTNYDKGGFSLEDHEELASECMMAAGRGARVIVSNNHSEALNRMFAKSKVEERGAKIEWVTVALTRTMKTVIGGERDLIQEALIFLAKAD